MPSSHADKETLKPGALLTEPTPRLISPLLAPSLSLVFFVFGEDESEWRCEFLWPSCEFINAALHRALELVQPTSYLSLSPPSPIFIPCYELFSAHMSSMQTECYAVHREEHLMVDDAPARCILLCCSATWWKRRGLEGPRMSQTDSRDRFRSKISWIRSYWSRCTT